MGGHAWILIVFIFPKDVMRMPASMDDLKIIYFLKLKKKHLRFFFDKTLEQFFDRD